MKFGYFIDRNRECVITRPDTPLPWINFLGCRAYFGIISNTAGGYSFYRDARLRLDLKPYRYELIISSKAGWDMWPGPYGDWGSRKYLLASLDQSLKRMGLEYMESLHRLREAMTAAC